MKSSGFASDFQIGLSKGISSLSAAVLKLPHPAFSHLLPLTRAKDRGMDFVTPLDCCAKD